MTTRAAAISASLLIAGAPFLTYGAEETGALQMQIDELKREMAQLQNPESRVHLSGYAAVDYTDAENDSAAFNEVSFNPIFHYQYRELFLLEAEMEIAVDETGETETELEYGAIDWFINDYMVLQAGKFLSPIGQFRQNIHPAWINKFASAPPGYGHDGAIPLAEVGVQLRGGFRWDNSWRLNYALYTGNGPKIEIVGTEIHAVETEGTTANGDGELVFGGRLGLLPISSLEFGVSAAGGEISADDEVSVLRDYEVYGVDISWRPGKAWDFRGEHVKTKVGSNPSSAVPESADWAAWYAQGAYRFLPGKWEAVVRYSDFNSHIREDDQKQWAGGVNYWFAPNAVTKVGYEQNDGLAGSPSDDDRWLVQLAYGF